MSQQDDSILISSDEEEVVNQFGKRVRSDSDEDSDIEDYSMDEEDEEEDEEEGSVPSVEINQSLPEDHEAVVVSERTEQNPLQELDDIFQQLKIEYTVSDTQSDEIEPSFSCGNSLHDEAPRIAFNVEGISGPIAFPLEEKDAARLFHAFPSTKNEQGKATCLEIDASKIQTNLSFQEYLSEIILPDVTSRLGVDKSIAQNTRLESNRLFVLASEGTLPFFGSIQSDAYATLLIVLPSYFSGGDILTVYDSQDVIYQTEDAVIEGYYYLAWYNNVHTKFFPVTEGYQVILDFSLIHHDANAESLQKTRMGASQCNLSTDTETKIKPVMDRASNYLKGYVSNFKSPIFYMLKYSYHLPRITVDQLKPSDKQLAKIVYKIADEAGYALFLGSIERDLEGKTNTQGKRECPMDEEGVYVTQSVVYDEFILISLLDLNGNDLLTSPIGLDTKENHTIIQGKKWYAQCKPDSQHCSMSKTTIEQTVKYWYSGKTALVLIPKTQVNTFIKSLKNPEDT